MQVKTCKLELNNLNLKWWWERRWRRRRRLKGNCVRASMLHIDKLWLTMLHSEQAATQKHPHSLVVHRSLSHSLSRWCSGSVNFRFCIFIIVWCVGGGTVCLCAFLSFSHYSLRLFKVFSSVSIVNFFLNHFHFRTREWIKKQKIWKKPHAVPPNHTKASFNSQQQQKKHRQRQTTNANKLKTK